MAVTALALMPTFHTSSETLAVVLLAGRFFARASPSWDVGNDSFEVPGVTVVCDLLCEVDLVLVSRMIFAAQTYAVPIAESPFGKAFTVELQAIDFGAFTAGVLFLLPNYVLEAIAGRGSIIMAVTISFFQKFLEQVLVVGTEALLVYHTQ